MKAISTVFESILTNEPVIWTPEEEGPLSAAGPRISTVWGWGG